MGTGEAVSNINWQHLWEAIPLRFWVVLVEVEAMFIVIFSTAKAGLATNAMETFVWLAIVVGVLIWSITLLEKVERRRSLSGS